MSNAEVPFPYVKMAATSASPQTNRKMRPNAGGMPGNVLLTVHTRHARQGVGRRGAMRGAVGAHP